MVLTIQEVVATFASVLLALVHMRLIALPKSYSATSSRARCLCILRAITHSVHPWAIPIFFRNQPVVYDGIGFAQTPYVGANQVGALSKMGLLDRCGRRVPVHELT
jgi:hypothetical protein